MAVTVRRAGTSATAIQKPRLTAYAMGYLVLISIAEVVTVVFHPIAGIGLQSALLIALIINASLAGPESRRLLLCLTLAPLIRILSLSMPLTVLPQVYWYPIIYFPLGAATFMVMRQVGLGWKEVGLLPRQVWLQVMFFPVGALLAVTEYFILRPEPIVSGFALGSILPAAAILLMTTGFVEEWVFRGVIQKVVGEQFGWWGLVYASFLFAVLHLGFLSLVDLGFVFAVAMLFAWVVRRTGSLLGVVLAHGLTNIGLYVFLPLLLG